MLQVVVARVCRGKMITILGDCYNKKKIDGRIHFLFVSIIVCELDGLICQSRGGGGGDKKKTKKNKKFKKKEKKKQKTKKMCVNNKVK